ncbi:unnamed protein product [Rhizophagus irregularis]|nr:unnamed protein product [Rhizophagus irregularis]
MCKNCSQLFKYDYKIGTSSLKHHKCPSDEKQPKITTFWGKKEIPTAAKEVTSKKLINLVCKDIRPFEIIVGQDFREFAQEMINIGATYGNLPVDNLFLHPTTLSRNVVKKAEIVKNDFALKLKYVFELFGGVFTTDMWTDDYRKISYISLTVHYIDENWQICEQILAVSKFPDVSHTAEQIKKVVLEKSLKQESETRWNSKIVMLESINDQFEAIRNILIEKEEESRIENIDLNILQNLITFLRKFREASEFLEGSKYPTLYDEMLTHIKYVVEQKMKSKIKIEDIYKIAVFFDPRMKQLKILEESDVKLVKNKIRSQCASITNKDDESDDSTATVQEKPIKKCRKSKETNVDFSQYYDSSSDDNNEDEVDQYVKSKVPKDKNLDVLKWWKEHRLEFPKLAILCAYYLSIPASSASSEREFSKAGQTINERHTSLKPETVDSILVLHSALQ